MLDARDIGSNKDSPSSSGTSSSIMPERLGSWSMNPALMAGAGLLVVCGILIQLWIMLGRRFPGDADAGYYFNVASNLVNGNGFVADTLWYFRINSSEVQHYGGAYWKPLEPLIAAAGMKLFGPTVAAALLPNYIFVWVLAFCTILSAATLSRRFDLDDSERKYLYLLCFFTCAFQYWVFWNAINVVPATSFAVLGFFCLYFVQRLELRYAFVAGVLAGLSCLSRNDGLFLLPVTVIFLLLVDLGWREKAKMCALFVAGMLPILVGERLFVIVNGLPSANPLNLLFITSFEDIYLLPEDMTLSHFLTGSIQMFIIDRAKALGLNIRRIFEHFGTLLTLLAGAGAIALRSRDRRTNNFMLIWLVYLGFELAINSFVLPYTGMEGSFRASILVAFPAGIALAFIGLFWLARDSKARKFLGFAVAISIAIPTLIESSRAVRAGDPPKMNVDRQVGMVIDRLAAEDNIPIKNVVVMGRINSGDFSVITGLRHLYIPAGGREAMNAVIARYRPQYLVIDGTEAGLADLYSGEKPEKQFQYVGPIEGTSFRAFRISGN